MLNELGVPSEENTSEVDALKLVLEERDSCNFFLDGIPDTDPVQYEQGKDHELFSVLPLCLLPDSIGWIQSKSKYSHVSASAYAIKAMDAVCYAEHLIQSEWLVSYAKLTASKELAMALRKQKVEHFTKLTVIQQESDDKLRRAAKVLAKNAVSQRPDQILKPGWITHCTTLKHGGAVINNLDDLLSAPGYDAEITSIAPRTLKAWAKDAGITLKAGRPKNNHAPSRSIMIHREIGNFFI